MVALTPGPHVALLAGTDAEKDDAATTGGTSRVCRMIDPANPTPPADRCPDPERANILTQDIPLRHVALEPGGSLTYRLPASTQPAADLALHLSPFEERPGGLPLRLTVTDAAGASCRIDIPADHPVLAPRTAAKSTPPSSCAAST